MGTCIHAGHKRAGSGCQGGACLIECFCVAVRGCLVCRTLKIVSRAVEGTRVMCSVSGSLDNDNVFCGLLYI